MQSQAVDSVRISHPLVLAGAIAAMGALLMTTGCTTRQTSPPVEQPPTVVMPPSPPSTNVVELMPPPALPEFKVAPPPAHVPQAVGITYTIKKGDSLSLIAAKYGVSAREIAELNGIANPNKIRVGQKLVLPAYAKERAIKKSSSAKAKSVAKKPAAAAAAPVAAGGEYVVRSGDSLWKIAHEQHVKMADLRAVNNLQSDKLQVGQKLKLPGGQTAAPAAPVPEAAPAVAAPVVETPPPAVDTTTPPAVAPAPAPAAAPAVVADMQTFEVTVDAGETLDSIATKYGVLPADITKLNNITEVAPGQKIKLPLPTP